jgi:hypothetical protein
MRRRGVMAALFRLRLLGWGDLDDFGLPGESSQKVTVFLVACPDDHFSYESPKWVRGKKCPEPECDQTMECSELPDD